VLGVLLDFGVRLPNSGPLASPGNIVETARHAEKLGYHSVWVHDHIIWSSKLHGHHISAGSKEALTSDQKPNFYESLTSLAVVAGATNKIKLGVAVIVLPLRNPLVFAKQTSTLDALSGGRFILGVSPGSPSVTKPEFEAVNVDFESRAELTDEYIRAIREIWSSESASFEGKFVRFRNVSIFPKPVSQPSIPIWIGGPQNKLNLSAPAIARTGMLGDGWLPAYLTADEIRHGSKEIRRIAKSQGRLPESITIGNELFVCIDDDSELAKAGAVSTLKESFPTVEDGLNRNLVGNPREVRQALSKFRDAGTTFIELKFIYRDLDSLGRMMMLFADQVMPEFR